MYAKVFAQIFDSSIAEDYRVRLVFEDFLKLADINGVVDMTHEAISRRTNVPLEMVKLGISELEKPDPKSRSNAEDGRRIIRMDDHRDWGWFIVNYQRYRLMVTEEQRREKTKQRVRKHRNKNKLTPCNAPVTLGNDCNAMEMEREMEKKKEEVPPPLILPPLVQSPAPVETVVGVSDILKKEIDRREWVAEHYAPQQHLPEIPPMSRNDYNKMVSMSGVPLDFADWFWNTSDGCGWIDKSGRPIRNVRSSLLAALSSRRANQAQQKAANGYKVNYPPSEKPKSIQDKELEAVMRSLK